MIRGDRLETNNLHLSVTPGAIKLLANRGCEPDNGARPLKSIIQSFVEDPFSEAIVSGDCKEGDRIKLRAKSGQFLLTIDNYRSRVAPLE